MFLVNLRIIEIFKTHNILFQEEEKKKYVEAETKKWSKSLTTIDSFVLARIILPRVSPIKKKNEDRYTARTKVIHLHQILIKANVNKTWLNGRGFRKGRWFIMEKAGRFPTADRWRIVLTARFAERINCHVAHDSRQATGTGTTL